jgi:hypothetical protein
MIDLVTAAPLIIKYAREILLNTRLNYCGNCLNTSLVRAKCMGLPRSDDGLAVRVVN